MFTSSTIQTHWLDMNSLEGHGGSLTYREKQILHLISKGHSQKEVARHLYVSVDTVKKHLQNSYRKLGATNKVEALVRAGLIGKDSDHY